MPTIYRFTGQKQESSLGGTDGLYYFGARWYDPALGRFIQPDIIVPGPGNPTAWDRYAYAYDNPIIFIDPTGHLGSQPSSTDQCGPDGLLFPIVIDETDSDILILSWLDAIQKATRIVVGHAKGRHPERSEGSRQIDGNKNQFRDPSSLRSSG